MGQPALVRDLMGDLVGPNRSLHSLKEWCGGSEGVKEGCGVRGEAVRRQPQIQVGLQDRPCI